MVLVNLDTSDGLTNGAVGVLTHVTIRDNQPKVIWLDFVSEVGIQCRMANDELMHREQRAVLDTPLQKYQDIMISFKTGAAIYRSQFAVVPAEAMTFHKSQCKTMTRVAVHVRYFPKSKTKGKGMKIKRTMLYVGCSRVTSLDG